MSSSAAHASQTGFDRLYGLELVEVGEERARAKVAVRDELKQPLGWVHGGVYAAIAESLARVATERAVGSQGNDAVGLAGQTSFLRPITEGTIHAQASARHRGRTTWVWEVEISDDHGRLCALARITIALGPGSAA